MPIKSPPYLCIPLLGCLSLGLSVNVQAKTPPSGPDLMNVASVASIKSVSDRLVLFEPPNDDKADNSRGGASRPTQVKCLHDESYRLPLTALIPESGVGLTVAPHPTLLVYVPPTTATQAHLTLRDENHSGLYQTRVQMPQTGGVLSITLPTDSPALAMDKTYHWSLAILCQPTQTDVPIARGQIRRVELPVERSDDTALSEQPSLLSQAVVYGRSGVWHDMLLNLVMLQQTQPDNRALRANWAEVLDAENLGAIANMPLLD